MNYVIMADNIFESLFMGCEVLYREFCNNVYLGQWEMARACVLSLFQVENCSEERLCVAATLKCLATNPSLCRLPSPQLPSPSYMSFLSCQLLEKCIGHLDKVHSLRKVAEFHILLEELLSKASEGVWKDLSLLYLTKRTHTYSEAWECNKISSQDVNEETLVVLKDTTLKDPHQTTVLMEKLLCHDKSTSDFGAANGKIFGVFLQCLMHYLVQLNSSFDDISSDMTMLNNVGKRVHLFLSLIPDMFDGFKPNENLTLDDALGLIVSLCATKVFERTDVYQSLLGRESPKLLKWFCRKEDDYYNRSLTTVALKPSPETWHVVNPDGSLNHHEALLWSLKSKSHFLEHVLDCAVKCVLEGNACDLLYLQNDAVLSRLQPLVLILAWESCSDDASANNVIEALKFTDLGGPCDNIILECCQKLQYNAYATDWLINYLRDQKQDIHHFEVFNRTRNIFTQLQTVSPLRLLHKTFGLKSVPPGQVIGLLSMKPKGIHQEHSNCDLTDKETFHGYLAITYMMDAIYCSSVLHHILIKENSENLSLIDRQVKPVDPSCASDSTSSRCENNFNFSLVDDHISFKTDKASMFEYIATHGFQAAFEHFVLRMLKKSNQEVRNVSVFSFRVEILENLFCLLFLTKNDFGDTSEICSDSDEGSEGDEKRLQKTYFESPSSSVTEIIDPKLHSWSRSSSVDKSQVTLQETNVASSDMACSLNQNGEVMKIYSGQFILSTTKLKDPENVSEEIGEIYSGHGSSRSTGSNSSSTISATGFLCNELIVKELLLMLKDAILELEAEWCKSSKAVQGGSKEQVKDRCSKLLQLVHEAQWRYDLVHSENFQALLQSDLVVSENETLNASSFDDIKYPLVILRNQLIPGSVNKSKRTLKHKRKKKRKRCSESYTTSDCAKQDPDIIQRMLSTPDALIRYSMWRGNSMQAEQVIELFKLKNSVEARELCFSNNISKLKARIVDFDKNQSILHENSALPLKFESENTIGAIALEVSSGIVSTSAVSFIDQQLNIIGIPEECEFLNKVENVSLVQRDLLFGYKNLHSVILGDLSLTACVSPELSSLLLDMALKKWKEHEQHKIPVGAKKKQRTNSEYMKFICTMMSFLKEILSFNSSKCDNSISLVFFPSHDSPKISFSSILVNYIGTLDCSQFNNHRCSWEKFCLMIDKFLNLFEKVNSENKISKIYGSKKDHSEYKNDIHTSFKKLIKSVRNLSMWTKDVIKPQSDKYIDYLNILFLHLKQVTEALQGYNFQNQYTAEECSSYFSVLQNSPSELLLKIVTETGNIPQRVEKLALDMKMDIVHVLTQWYFPHIPLSYADAPVSRIHCSPRYSIGSIGFPCIILNNMSEKLQSPRHPCLVAKELLEDFLHMVQAFTSAKESGILSYRDMIFLSKHSSILIWENKCSELACIDLDLLQSREEKLSFFVNVTNVAWLHAVLSEISMAESFGVQESEVVCHFHSSCEENFSEDTMNAHMCHITSPVIYERLVRQKVVGYSIGQLGIISLFDLRYQVLHMYVTSPRHLESPPFNRLLGSPKEQWVKYAPPAEPRLIFVLCECILSSPKLQILDPTTINDQLEDAMKDFLNYTVRVDEEKLQVEFPQLLEWYALDLEGTYETDINKAQFEGLVNLVSTFLRGNLAQSLHFLLSLDFLHGFSENIDYSGKNQLPFHLEFSPGSSKFGVILEYISIIDATECSTETVPTKSQTYPQSNILHYLKGKCWLLADLYSFIDEDTKELTEDTYLHSDKDSSASCENDSPIERLLTQYKTLWSTTSSDTDEALHCFVSSLCPVPIKEYTLQQIQKCFLAEEWEALLEYVYLFLALRNDYIAEFFLLLQLTLQHLSCQVPKLESQFLEPWSCAMCIPDPSVKVEYILKNVSKWPETSAIQALRYCLVDSSIKHRTALFDAVDKELKKVLVYKKILDSCKTNKPYVQQHVPVFSTWQELAESSIHSQSAVLKCMEAYKLYDLAVEWRQLHSIGSQQEMDYLALQILSLLEQNSADTEGVYKVLNGLGNASQSIALCQKILPKVSSLMNKLCLVQYLTSIDLEYPEKKQFYNLLFGLKMLLALSFVKEENYLVLTEYPLHLLEQLLMNKEVKEASQTLQAVSEELKAQSDLGILFNQQSISKLVEKYAFKAIELRTVDIELESSSSSSTALSSEDICSRSEQFVMPSSVPTKDKWIADSKVQICQVCREEQFNMFCRRHHCRRCGRVICSNCSQNTLIVEGYGKVGVRVCDDCFNQTTLSVSTERRHSVSPYARRTSGLEGGLFQLSHVPLDPVENLRGNNILRWQLSPEEEQNISVRNEFSYEEAPSVPLCLSILKLHLDTGMCAKFMLTLCNHLISKIKPSPSGKMSTEVDYSLVISMVRALLLNAKMKYHDIQNIDDLADVDTYFQYLDVIQLLVNDNCKHLIPREELTSMETVRKLCDKLVEEERMSLAQEVSTKCGLDKSTIWKAWGLFYLRAGCWPAAREKFTKCIQVPNDRSKQKQEDPLLNKIVTILEEPKYSVDEKVPSVYGTLESLQSLRKGICPVRHEKTQFDDQKRGECLFYLLTYGTYTSVVSFYQRHGLLSEALNYILEKKCHPDVFVETIFMPSVKCDQLTSLQLLLHSSDPSLFTWWSYLIHTCRYLQRLEYFNVLSNMQVFMKDYIRAAKSSINFYLAPADSYCDLHERLHYLRKAKSLLEEYLRDHPSTSETDNYPPVNKTILTLPTKEVESYIRTIVLQEEVSHFFHFCNMQNIDSTFYTSVSDMKFKVIDSSRLPTLFDSGKPLLITMILTNSLKIKNGFDLSLKIIKEYGLNATSVLISAVHLLNFLNRSENIPPFLLSLKSTFGIVINIDEITMECIAMTVSQEYQAEYFEELLKFIVSDVNKINAYLKCGRLKSAFLLAVKRNCPVDIHRIMKAAEESGQHAVRSMCEKWLQTHS